MTEDTKNSEKVPTRFIIVLIITASTLKILVVALKIIVIASDVFLLFTPPPPLPVTLLSIKEYEGQSKTSMSGNEQGRHSSTVFFVSTRILEKS